MPKNANKNPSSGARPRRSIRDISLPKKDEETAAIADSYNQPAERWPERAARSEQAERPMPSRRTKHLVIDNQDDNGGSANQAEASAQRYAPAEMGTYDLESADMEPRATIEPDETDESEIDSSIAAAASASATNSMDDEDRDVPPARPASKPRPKTRAKWEDHVEKAFMSSDDIEEMPAQTSQTRNFQKAKNVDPDDVGNTSKTSHFAPLSAARKKRGRKMRAVLVTIVALAIIFGLMQTVFARVVVSIPNGKTSINFAEEILAAEVQSSGITKNSEKKVLVEAVKNVDVSKKATGTIILYNNYSTQPYDLIKTTRVQTANGSVYRLTQDVTIPGKKGSTPGTVNAKVEAELPGSEYNAKGGTELKLPGLIAGTDKYKQIYAKVSANFTGGAKGSAPDLAGAGVNSAIDTAKNEVKAEFLTQVATENPDLVILPDSVVVVSSFDSTKIPAPATSGANAGKSEITVKFTTKAVGLKRDSLKSALEATTASKGTATNFSNDVLDVLNYAVVETPADSVAGGMFQVKASGAVDSVLTEALQEKLKVDLAGKPLGTAKMLVDTQFSGQDVSVKAWPFWMKDVPADTGKIKVKVGN